VAQPAGRPDLGATWLVATFRASRPGVYRIREIRVSYHSGYRALSAASHQDICLLIYPAGEKAMVLSELSEPVSAALGPPATPATDSLVQNYDSCLHEPAA
jgi:hypothetical protein